MRDKIERMWTAIKPTRNDLNYLIRKLKLFIRVITTSRLFREPLGKTYPEQEEETRKVLISLLDTPIQFKEPIRGVLREILDLEMYKIEELLEDIREEAWERLCKMGPTTEELRLLIEADPIQEKAIELLQRQREKN